RVPRYRLALGRGEHGCRTQVGRSNHIHLGGSYELVDTTVVGPTGALQDPRACRHRRPAVPVVHHYSCSARRSQEDISPPNLGWWDNGSFCGSESGKVGRRWVDPAIQVTIERVSLSG